MSKAHTQRVDRLISQLGQISNTIRHNPEVEFDIDHLLPIVETSVEALAQEIDDEVKS